MALIAGILDRWPGLGHVQKGIGAEPAVKGD
jgi:hypothetical protein